MKRDAYHHGDLPAALLAAGRTALEADGLDALNLRALARRAGVSAAAVYRHFADKEQLLASIAAEGFAALVDDFETAAAGAAGGAPLDRLRAVGAAYVAFALAHPGLYRLMFGRHRPSVAGTPALETSSRRAYALLEAAVGACCGAGAEARTVTESAIAAWSLVHGYAMLRLEGQLDELPSQALPDTGAILAKLLPGAA